MPDDDRHDPLDSWLGQQVRPLPPPPGTFELITRRARRRKLGKLVAGVVSAGALVAAVAIATPPLLSLRTTPGQEQASRMDAGRSAAGAGAGTQQPAGNGNKETPKPTSLATAATKPGAPAAVGGPVPANFQPASVTFVSTSTAWVIGQAGTPGSCANANPDVCTSIAHTGDTGKTWTGGPAPGTPGPSGAQGVSGIRFLDGTNGWAFGPELWATHDAGRTWTQVNTNGQRVTDLETAGDRAFALWATCSGSSASFAADCTSYTLMTTTANGDTWTPVGSATTGLGDGGNATSAVLALTSATGYLLAPDGALYSGPLDGSWQRAGTAPCQPSAAQPGGLPSSALLALVSPTTVVVACEAAGGVTVSTSASSGANWTPPPAGAWSALPSIGTPTSLAAAPDGTLALATTNGLYTLPAGGTRWQQASLASAADGGFSYVGMTSSDQGVALPADTSLHEIWMTFDGGQTWAPRTPITPAS
jgi:hypothetical protein